MTQYDKFEPNVGHLSAYARVRAKNYPYLFWLHSVCRQRQNNKRDNKNSRPIQADTTETHQCFLNGTRQLAHCNYNSSRLYQLI